MVNEEFHSIRKEFERILGDSVRISYVPHPYFKFILVQFSTNNIKISINYNGGISNWVAFGKNDESEYDGTGDTPLAAFKEYMKIEFEHREKEYIEYRNILGLLNASK